MASIDNRWYDRLGDSWWDEAGPVAPLHQLNPARFAYFQRVLGELYGKTVLDLGCGGGILSEEFARAGAIVTGADMSGASLMAARRHCLAGGLKIDYINCDGSRLPFSGSSFDVVVSSDFLEHVADLEATVKECSRVLKPSGFFLYETINRTFRSRVVGIWLLERVLRIIPRNTHDPSMFIKPDELHELMARSRIKNVETYGVGPTGGSLRALARLIRTHNPGPFGITRDQSISYVGYGIKGD